MLGAGWGRTFRAIPIYFIQHWSEQAMRVEGRVARGHCGAGLQQAVCFLFYIIYLNKF